MKTKISRKSRARKSIGSSSRAVAPVVPRAAAIPDAAEIMRLKTRGRMEADMIASALRDAPPLDRERMGAELYPFNDIASAPIVQDVVAKIVRKRLPGNAWPDAHRALIHTDDNGRGYAEFMDTYRNTAFLVGIDFALRSLPSWWREYQSLPDVGRALLGRMVVEMADSTANGGAR